MLLEARGESFDRSLRVEDIAGYYFYLGDIDGDGDVDIAAASDGMEILLNDGPERFTGRHLELRYPPSQISLADFDRDGDGDGDGAYSSYSGSHGARILALEQESPGRFVPLESFIQLARRATSLTVADFDGDGHPDLAMAGEIWRYDPYSRRDCDGNGVPDGCDSPALDCNINGFIDRCEILGGLAEDCDGNGIPDECDRAFGGGNCNSNEVLDTCEVTDALALDLNQNGLPDECDEDCNRNGIYDALELEESPESDCDQNGVPDECDLEPGLAFVPSGVIDPRRGASPGVRTFGDLDDDNDADLAVVVGLNVDRYLNLGFAGWRLSGSVRVDSQPVRIAAADLDGDGHDDLVTANDAPGPLDDNVTVILSDGARGHRLPRNFVAGRGPVALLVRDFEGDGVPDVWLTSRAPGMRSVAISRLRNSGDGTLAPGEAVVVLSSGSVAWSLTPVDIDEDGDVDLVVTAEDVFLLENDGTGTFARPRPLSFGFRGAIVAGDMDGDGDPDFAAYSQTISEVTWFENRGDGQFAPWSALPMDFLFVYLAFADFDADGDLDLAAKGPDLDRFAVFLNHGHGSFLAPKMFGSGRVSSRSWAVADFDGDGRSDVSVGNSILHNGVGPGAPDADGNGLPDRCYPDCNQNGTPDELEPSELRGDCNDNALPDECDVLPAIAFDQLHELVADAETFGAHAADLNGDEHTDLIPGHSGIEVN